MKGVPEERLEDRLREIMQYINDDQLTAVYKEREPWSTLKTLLANRVRMVLPAEAKAKKGGTKEASHSSAQADDVGPWTFTDPWAESRQKSEKPEPPAMQLLPEFFACKGDSVLMLFLEW